MIDTHGWRPVYGHRGAAAGQRLCDLNGSRCAALGRPGTPCGPLTQFRLTLTRSGRRHLTATPTGQPVGSDGPVTNHGQITNHEPATNHDLAPFVTPADRDPTATAVTERDASRRSAAT